MRLVMYPVLLVRFWRVLEGYPWWDRGLVVLCQAMLCMFNYGVLRLCLPHDLSVGHQVRHTRFAEPIAVLVSQVLPCLSGWVCRVLQAWQGAQQHFCRQRYFQQMCANQESGACKAQACKQATGHDSAVL